MGRVTAFRLLVNSDGLVNMRKVMEVTLRVILTLVGPWLHSNYEVMETARIAQRDANAAKVAVTRLRQEIRGEQADSSEPTDRPLPETQPLAAPRPQVDLKGIRPGTPLSKLTGRRE